MSVIRCSAVGALALVVPAAASAQETGAFGREAVVVSVEQIVGFQSLEMERGKIDLVPQLDSAGIQPPYWSGIGVFRNWSSGFSLGGLAGITYIELAGPVQGGEEVAGSVTLVRLRPRVGYAGSSDGWLGFWLRGGPSAFMLGGEASGSTFGGGVEAYAVLRAAPHFAVLVGPTFEYLPFGDYAGDDFEYKAFTVSVGVLADFWAEQPSARRADPAPARVERGFGRDHRLVVGIENLAGVMHRRVDVEGEGTLSSTMAGLFAAVHPAITPQQQLGLHYFVVPPLSIGIGLHHSENDDLGETLLVAPRIGVGIPLGSALALWPRAGITYFESYAPQRIASVQGVSAGGEALLVLQAVEHFGVMLGASFEYGLSGKLESTSVRGPPSAPTIESTQRRYDFIQFGAALGVLADF